MHVGVSSAANIAKKTIPARMYPPKTCEQMMVLIVMRVREPETTHEPWTRIVILIAGLAGIAIVSWITTGRLIPANPRDSLVFQTALLLIVLGSALLEHKFTRPADAAINSLMGSLTLIPVFGLPNSLVWWIVFLYCSCVCLLALTCVAVSSGPTLTGWQRRLADITYRPVVVFGRARVLFSAIFLYAVLSFYGVQSERTAILVVFWGVFIALWPLGVPDLLSQLRTRVTGLKSIGSVVRSDAPNIVHVSISPDTIWEPSSIKLILQGDGRQRYVIPLFSRITKSQSLGTGLCVEDIPAQRHGLNSGQLYEVDGIDKTAAELLGIENISSLVGFVDQESSIGRLSVHTWNPTKCREGMLVWSDVGSTRVYYQVTEGFTKEEILEGDRDGYQMAFASQLGVLDPDNGFEKTDWLPAMNSPVFTVPAEFVSDKMSNSSDDFKYGCVPGTALSVVGQFADMMEYHTAILGVTGSGKTELAFDLIRYALKHDTKVICIDLTARYKGRLNDIGPVDLSISAQLSADLGKKLFDVETGQYGASAEKKALKEFSDRLRHDINTTLTGFLGSRDVDKQLGIITLEEISNTKATIFITELYLTCLLTYARDHSDTCPRVLLVVEEAHTVMPEATTMGLGDYDSRGIVAKIAQIALQGRKYHVGLLVIAQRTATVSKTVLTQCNTIVSFSCFDDTSLGFLENFFGRTHTAAIPNLQFLQAVVFGKGVRSQRPIIVQIPFDRSKSIPQRDNQ